MNGSDLVGVNNRAPGSGNRCTRGRPFSVLSRTPRCGSRNSARNRAALLNFPRLSAFQGYHIASARQNAPNECFRPFELRRMEAQSVTLSSVGSNISGLYLNYRIL